MKLKPYKDKQERRLLIGMVVNSDFLGALCERPDIHEMFSSRWCSIVAQWCIRHYQKYDRAPAEEIETIAAKWGEKQEDTKTVELVERFLEQVSSQYDEQKEKFGTDYLLDLAAEHFNRVKLQRTVDEVDGLLSKGEIQDAQAKWEQYDHIEIGAGSGVDVLEDEEALKRAFQSEDTDALVRFQDGLQRFMNRGGVLGRDSFLAIMGPEKRGKTWWLIEFAWRALLARKKVAFFEVGDMSEKQLFKRFGTRAARHPSLIDYETNGLVRMPTHLDKLEDGTFELQYDEKQFSKPLSWPQAAKAFQRFKKTKLKSKKPYLRMSVHPNFSVNVNDIDLILSRWERQGWVPDVVIIDYADILAPLPGRMDQRDQINTQWKMMRGLSQKWHTLLVTATQADAASYKAPLITLDNFTDDKRKYGHVTGMLALNQTFEEKERQLMRLNWLVLRDASFNPLRCCTVSNCLALGRPAIQSHY